MIDFSYQANVRTKPISYTVRATPEAVFTAWVTPSMVEKWWGPDGFTTRVLNLTAEVGGSFAFEMTAPDGSSCVMSGVYRCVDRPKLLSFEVHEHCNLSLPHGTEPQKNSSLVEVVFRSSELGTVVSLTHTLLNPDYAELAVVSWAQSLRSMDAQFSGSVNLI
ncbi:SRPBCC family protein [Microbulbifer variabilis]|uniref:SRPBCC family protein n=1 Tax=Microbulbifer variabilis TaxID=266805 RepID=UPI000364403C|nr:SRPBCC domain-containing protein [Microbulbifer variabilis]